MSGLRTHFDKQLGGTDGRFPATRLPGASRGGTCDEGVGGSRDVDLACDVIAADSEINRLRYDIETQCYALFATEQPVARDMPYIATAGR